MRSLGIHRLPCRACSGAGDLTTPFAVRKLARQLDIDVLHGHGAKGGFYARLARLGGSKARRALHAAWRGAELSASSPSGGCSTRWSAR